MLTDPIQVTLLVIKTMEKLGIHYLIGGSLASSIHGIARASRAVDIIADIQQKDTQVLADVLKDRFYVDAEAIRDAVKYQGFFNLIHLDSMFKIDVYVLKQDNFSIEEFKRRQKVVLMPSPGETAYIATPEDTIISKLIWYKKGNEVSENQWSDVLGVMNVEGKRLDMNYLGYWANKLNINDLLERALE